jgi:hypothetical protein
MSNIGTRAQLETLKESSGRYRQDVRGLVEAPAGTCLMHYGGSAVMRAVNPCHIGTDKPGEHAAFIHQ